MEDYYGILGLDVGASPESIKLAYRRLARETHPDRNASSSENVRSDLEMRMARLNEAYAVLSDARRRREYDEKLRLQKLLTSGSKTPVSNSSSANRSGSPQKIRHRPPSGAEAEVVNEFSHHLRTALLADSKVFSWKRREFEGFDWGLEALFWSSYYCVAVRGFSQVDAAAVKKFVNYAQILIAQTRRHLRKSFFLFLIPFQHLTDWDSVSLQCQRFLAEDRAVGDSGMPAGILLLDLQHGRTLRFGRQVSDKRFQQLMESVGTPS